MTDWITQRCLQELDGSELTTKNLSMRIGVDDKPVYQRLRNLEKAGKVDKKIVKNKAVWRLG